MKRSPYGRLGLLVLTLGLLSCGSRSGLRLLGESTKEEPECRVDKDCVVEEDMCLIVACQAGACAIVGNISCDDGDPCTDDACDPGTGECRNEPVTYDLDGDGHRAPLPGFLPGEPGACGDDCDDTNANAHPGALEVCDGVDNDCNGVVDDGMAYVPADDAVDALRISADDMPPAGPGGIAFGKGGYLAAHTGRRGGKDGVYVSLLGEGGSVSEELKLNAFPADASGGPVVFTGDRFGIAWQDRRDGDYEVYFNTLNEDGTKRGPDVAVSRELGFSIGAAMTWTGREFVLVWQDDRFLGSGFSRFNVLAQRLDLEGNLIGQNQVLTMGESAESESPQIATGKKSVGIVYTRTVGTERRIAFQSFDFDLQPLANAPVELVPSGKNGVYPSIAWNKGTERYLVAFYDPDTKPHAVYAATLDENGNVLVPARPITESPRHSRYPKLLPLGNRSLLVFSDDKDQNQGYELYTKMLDDKLEPLGPELRLTHSPGDSVFPHTSFGPNGDIGILFRDDRLGGHHVWFSRLVCVAGEPL